MVGPKFDSMKGIPARTSISRFSITSPSKEKECESLEKCKVVSPTTFKGEQPSAWWADWFVGEIFPFRSVTVYAPIMLPVAPESIVKRIWVC